MKKNLILLLALFFLIIGGACFDPRSAYRASTKDIQELEEAIRESKRESREYDEEVNTFLITKDNQQLIIVGKKYHYILAIYGSLRLILTSPEKMTVKLSFDNFVVNSNQTVFSNLTLTRTIDIGKDFSQYINDYSLPYHRSSIRDKRYLNSSIVPPQSLSYRGIVQGKRYLANQFTLPITLQLKQKYKISVQENFILTSTSLNEILLTPLTVTPDGSLGIGKTPVLPLASTLKSIAESGQ